MTSRECLIACGQLSSIWSGIQSRNTMRILMSIQKMRDGRQRRNLKSSLCVAYLVAHPRMVFGVEVDGIGPIQYRPGQHLW